MQELSRAVGKAWQRARKRNEEAPDDVYRKLSGRMNTGTLRLVKYLIEEDGVAFSPGD
ncbi:unnamed protein product [Ectocarpus sp. 6 AP-2014]